MYLPRSDSGRIIVGTWWLVVLVVVTTYCGNLVAFLTFPKMEIPVNTVSQLVNEKHGFTWSIRSNTFLELFLKVICYTLEYFFVCFKIFLIFLHIYIWKYLNLILNTVNMILKEVHTFIKFEINQIIFVSIQETDIEKYVKLNESTETHDSINNVTMTRIRAGKHIVIDWETNLLNVMRKEFLETDKCEFTLSKMQSSTNK